MSVDFEATDWLALAHGPIVDIMITYGVLRGVVRLLDRRGRGMRTNPHLIAIVRRHIRRIGIPTRALTDFCAFDILSVRI